ncbi:MAG: PAS domain-containing protein [Candidatus Aminicenantes bacterium]|nr:PAS domain-containing protein [Candidatus Aminicenantes bacterium]
MKTDGFQGKDFEKKLMDLHVKMTEMERLELGRKREELPRSKTENEYRLFFEKEDELMVLLQDSIIVRVNSKVVPAMGYAVEELIGTEFMQYVHPDELPQVIKNYEKRMEGKDAPIVYKTVLKHKDGSDIRVEALAAKVTYRGNPADLVIIKKLKK